MRWRWLFATSVLGLAGCHRIFPYGAADLPRDGGATNERRPRDVGPDGRRPTKDGGPKSEGQPKDGPAKLDVSVACTPAGPALGHDTVTSPTTMGATISWQHPIESSGRLLTVIIAAVSDWPPDVSYGAKLLSPCQGYVVTGKGGLWICSQPTSSCRNDSVTITFSAAPSFVAAWATSWQGVSMAGAGKGNLLTSDPPTVGVSTSAGGVVVDVVIAPAKVLIPTTGQTLLGTPVYGAVSAIDIVASASSKPSAAGSTTMAWSLNGLTAPGPFSLIFALPLQ
jgi:hypothetical protein